MVRAYARIGLSYDDFVRRVTTLSIAMLVGLVFEPACSAVIGIDTDRVLDPGDASTTVDGGGGTSSADGSAPGADGGDAGGAPKCDPVQCATFGAGAQCNGENRCELACTSCGDKTLTCPPGHDCVLECKGEGCKNVRCEGGRSCTLDCRGASCDDAECRSATCNYQCDASSKCESAACRGDNRICNQECSYGGRTKECPRAVRCCPSSGEGGGGSAPRQCPGKTPNCE